jgi:hypothetical protein
MRNYCRGSASITETERFLTDWANMPGPWPLAKMDPKSSAARRRFNHRYGKVFGDPAGHPWLRDMLRAAWDTTDEREREWLCFRMRDAYAVIVRRRNMSVEEIRAEEDAVVEVAGAHYVAPPPTPLEDAIFHFQHQGKRALHCRNPDCPAPYFFASRKNQKFCGTSCQEPARREGQRLWWEKKHGKSKRRNHGDLQKR